MPSLDNRDLIVQAVRTRNVAAASAPAQVGGPEIDFIPRRRPRYVFHSAEFIDQVLSLRGAGATYTEIAAKLQITRNVVAGVLGRQKRRARS